MTDPVRVSIVTPFLNPGQFFEESIESVLKQTYDNWELLLVDDGSVDGSTEIAQRYAARHPQKIRYVAHAGRKNNGASASRNLGIRHARGEYLAFLDADDVYLPRKLEEQVPLLDGSPRAAMMYAATQYWYSWSGRAEDAGRDWIWRKYGVPANTLIEPPRMLITFLQDGGTVPCMGSVLARRDAVERVGGWEESFRYVCTDQVFHAKMCLHFPVVIADACWDRYRQHSDSACHSVERAGRTGVTFIEYLEWLERYLTSQRVDDPALWAALRQALRRYRHPLLDRLTKRLGAVSRLFERKVARALRFTRPERSRGARPTA